MDIAIILERKFQGQEWSLLGNEYENLIWLSNTTKPTKQEIEALWAEVQDEIETEKEAVIAKKASAQAKLQALGLTTDDLKALGLGGN